MADQSPDQSQDQSRAWGKAPRFLTLTDVAEVLNTSSAQVYALVRRKELKAIKIGGRGQWRVEASVLEEYIERMYAQTRDFVTTHPLTGAPATDDAVRGPDQERA
jgi:excisionase family DNA binding protein